MSKSVMQIPSAVSLTGANSPDGQSGTSEHRRKELADFLRTRREKLKPEQVGMSQGSRRRTPGLRREEVAELAGVGTTWYTWLEQARDIQPSAEVLRRLGHALQLNSAEMRHVYTLAGKATPLEIEDTTEQVTASIQRVLDEALSVPAILLGSRWDILAINNHAAVAFPAINQLPVDRRNWLYFIFCQQDPRTKVESWEMNARRLIAEFRASLSESLDSPWVGEIVEMLKTESPEFAKWWREHDVRDNATATVQMNEEYSGHRTFERTILRSMENPRYKFLIFTPIKSEQSK